MLLLWLCMVQAAAAQITVAGTVVAADTKLPLEGATVAVKGQSTRALSSEKGQFTFSASTLPVSVTVTYAGYETKDFTVTASPFIISLDGRRQALDEVVVTGYSTQNRKFIAGSIQTISGNTIRDIPAAGFNQLLQGKATGVQVSANSGVPGGGITFRIRGNNSINASVDPLYIIDGVFISNTEPIQTGLGQQAGSNPLADINPADIENITILKDANATAIYGSLGANGVVIVNTKRGRLNSKAKISLNAFRGWSTATKKYEVATGPETALLTNESRINTVLDNPALPPAALIPNPESQPTFNRTDDLFRTAATNNYELSAQGGTAQSTYYVGFGYLKQEGIVRPSDFERYSGRLNYDNYLSRTLKVGTSINISRTWRNVSSNDNNPQGVINSALFPRSYLPVFNADGTYARYGSFENHLALFENLNNKAVGLRIIGNLYGEWSILPELKFRSSWSADNNSVYENNYTNTLLAAGVANGGSATSIETKNQVLTAEQVLTYIKTVGGRHNLNALIGNTINAVLQQGTSANGTGFASNDLQAVSVASIRTGSSYRNKASLASFFGKASYTLDGKYTVDASLRADGSSRFGSAKPWAYFPSGGISWRAGQEGFVKNLNAFDELRFRASIGLAGNQNGVGPYAARGLWSSGSNYLDQPGVAPSQLANPNLTWETTRQFDVGTDFAILKNRISVTADYYYKYTTDLLLNVPVPSRTGYTVALQNFGAISNKGFEVAVRSTNVTTKRFTWTTEFNVSRNENRIEKLASDIAQGASGRNISLLRQGYPVNSFWLYKQLRVDPQTGNAVYDDVNKDGAVTAADRQIVGDALPRYTGGFTNNFIYGGFDFSVFLYFQQGNNIMNMNDFFLVHGGTQNNIGFLPRQLERWTKPGQITDIPRLTISNLNQNANNSAANNYGGSVANLSSRYLEDGSFIRLRTVQLSYTVPPSVVDRFGISSLRAYVQGTNLLTFTNYGGLDPEVSSQSANQNTAGYDWATVPQPKTIQVGLTVGF